MNRFTLSLTSTMPATRGVDAPPDDALLLERFFDGDDSALVTLYDRHNRRLFLYCLKFVGSAQQAEDIVQTMWEQVAMLRTRPRAISNPVGFFLRITRNLCLNHIKAGRRFTPLDRPDEQGDHTGRRTELEEIVIDALDELPDAYREVLVLHLFCGYRLEEIAVMSGGTAEAIRKRSSRARTRLREIVMKKIERTGR